jgi:hypothetical protein
MWHSDIVERKWESTPLTGDLLKLKVHVSSSVVDITNDHEVNRGRATQQDYHETWREGEKEG